MRTRARYAVARYAAIPLAAALLLTGCGRPGTAVTIDGERLTDAELATLVEQFSALTGNALTPGQLIGGVVQSKATLAAVQNNGGGASVEEAVAVLDRVAEGNSAEAIDYSDEMILIARSQIAGAALEASDPKAASQAAEDVAAALQEMDVEINPRFGTWDPEGVVNESGTLDRVLAPVNPFLLAPAEGLSE